MSDAAITSEPSVADIASVQAPDPVKITPREPEVKKPISIKESIEKNRAKLEAEVDPKALKTKEPAKEAKPAAKVDPKAAEAEAKAKPATEVKPADKTAERPRGEHGHFTADPNKTDAENETARVASEKATASPKSDRADVVDHRTVPKRFNTNSIRTESGEMLPGVTKEDWDSVPDKIKIETHRVFREMEAGLNKHRDRSQKYETYAEFDELAAKSGIDAKATVKNYVRLDQMMHSGDARQINAGITEVMKIAGITPRQYAEAVMRNGAQQQGGQQPDIARIVDERVKQALAPIQEREQQRTKEENERIIADWSKDKPQFPILKNRIIELIQTDGLHEDDAYATALREAQDVARELLGDSALKTPSDENPFDKAASELDEQIAKGSKSIKGANSAGSTPPRKSGPLPSIKESIARARQRL
jgi:hypothetical protein